MQNLYENLFGFVSVAGMMGKGTLAEGDLNNIKEVGHWSIINPNNYINNCPVKYGVLHSYYQGGGYPWLQVIYPRNSTYKQMCRSFTSESSWGDWIDIT